MQDEFELCQNSVGEGYSGEQQFPMMGAVIVSVCPMKSARQITPSNCLSKDMKEKPEIHLFWLDQEAVNLSCTPTIIALSMKCILVISVNSPSNGTPNSISKIFSCQEGMLSTLSTHHKAPMVFVRSLNSPQASLHKTAAIEEYSENIGSSVQMLSCNIEWRQQREKGWGNKAVDVLPNCLWLQIQHIIILWCNILQCDPLLMIKWRKK